MCVKPSGLIFPITRWGRQGGFYQPPVQPHRYKGLQGKTIERACQYRVGCSHCTIVRQCRDRVAMFERKNNTRRGKRKTNNTTGKCACAVTTPSPKQWVLLFDALTLSQHCAVCAASSSPPMPLGKIASAHNIEQ